MTTPEGKVKARVKEVLKRHGAYYHMPVMNGYGAPTLDFVGVIKGFYFAVETKAEDKQMTARQETTAAQIREAGGMVFLVNEVEGLNELTQWLQEMRNA